MAFLGSLYCLCFDHHMVSVRSSTASPFAMDTCIALVSAGPQGKGGREACAMALICCIALTCSSSTQNWHLYSLPGK